MSFQATITNEQTAELPSAHFDGKIIIVDRDDQITDVCRDLARQKIIGFDTETRPSFKAGITYKVALLQISTHDKGQHNGLRKMKLNNEILKILSSPEIIKIGADVAGDIRALHTLRNFNERGFIDLQHIASKWGIEEKSLRKMSAIALGQRVSKAQRLSNWEAAVLTPQQQMYAATDAWVCIKIYEKLLATKPLLDDATIATITPVVQAPAAKQAKTRSTAHHHRRRTVRHKRATNNNETHAEK